MEGVAEWQLAENAWIQVAVDTELASRTSVVVGVADIETQRAACAAADVVVGDVSDYGFVRTAEAVDPAGNKILFVQEVPMSSALAILGAGMAPTVVVKALSTNHSSCAVPDPPKIWHFVFGVGGPGSGVGLR